MKRVEIIVPQRKFDDIMLYLREQNALELLDVKEMIKGYGGGVTSAPTSERLYRLTTLESKINSVISALGITAVQTKPTQVEPRISDLHIDEVEKRVSEIEQQVTSATSETQSLESLISYAEQQLHRSVQEIAEIKNIDSPEGRHKLEEIVRSIFQTLRPSEMKLTGQLAELADAKSLEDAVVKDICNNIAQILATKHDEHAIAETITQTLGLKMKTTAQRQTTCLRASEQNRRSKDAPDGTPWQTWRH